MTRVLMTGDTVGGVWTFALELARALKRKDVEVVLATMGGPPPEAADVMLLASNRKLEWMEDPWEDVAAAGEWLLGIEKEFKPDVVHLNTLGHGHLPWRAPVVTTVHSCVASWWKAVKREPPPSEWSRYRSHVARSLRSTGLIAAPSQFMLDAARDEYGPALPDGVVVPNGRSAHLFRARGKEPFILTAGRLWDEAKNIAALDRIAGRLPWPVYVAGEQKAVPRFCHALGKLSSSELADWYGRAAIYVSPAKYEPFGLAILEAALSGCALVLSDIPSLRENWSGAALFAPLEEALSTLIEKPLLREDFSRRALLRAREFTPGRMADGYMAAYSRVMERSAACAS